MSKRLIDIAIGSLLAALAVPVILCLALVSAVTFRAWPFFVQTRVGYRGKPFRIVKVRTLPRCVPSAIDKHALANFALPRVATIMRSTHLDELPQLFLVPLGTMSLVGPRPEMLFLHEQGARAFCELRISVRPGCTGLWQVSRAAHGLIWDAAEYDTYYVENQTIRLDAWILARTGGLIFRRSAKLRLDDVPRWTRRRREPAHPGSTASDFIPYPALLSESHTESAKNLMAATPEPSSPAAPPGTPA